MTKKYSRALVTGGAGFIGSHIVDRLVGEGFEVTIIDNLDTGHLSNVANHMEAKEVHFVKGDIRDLNLARTLIKDIDVVFHEAAIASVTLSVKDPILVNDVNLVGTLNLLKAASDLGVERFVYASSGAVYGETESPQKKEGMVLNPRSPYGISKLAAELYMKVFYRLYGIETVSLRYFNVYGPRQRFDLECAYGGVVTILVNRLLRNMPPIIFGDGEQTRDFVYIQDVVDANMLAMSSKNAAGEAFNIGTSLNTSVNKVAETLKEIIGKRDLKNVHADPRPAEGRGGYADISKAERLLGFHPKVGIDEGLAHLVDWYRKTTH